MANPLAGDYQAVLQIAIRQINGLLGTLHQNGAREDAALKLPHSATARIGDPRRRRPDVEVFGDWLIKYQKAGPGRELDDIRAQLTTITPPGAGRMLSNAFEEFDRDWVIKYPPDVVRGRVKLQVSSPTITVVPGSSSEITVNAGIRAQYYPDADTTDLPAPIHGDVHAAYEVRRIQTDSGTMLQISPSLEDPKIRFNAAPGSGLSAGDENTLGVQVRKFLREELTPLPVGPLPDFPFAVFKGLGSGSSQVIALPFQLSGAPAPASGVQPLTQSFIGSSGFGFAVNKEYVVPTDPRDHRGLIDIEAIRNEITKRTFTKFGALYRLRFSHGPLLTFKHGGIEIFGRVVAETSALWAPNGFVEFKQLITLVLDTSTQTFSLVRVGEPNVTESYFLSHNWAINTVKSEIDIALAANTPSIRGAFADASSRLDQGLIEFDPSAIVSYTGVEITPDGIIIRGEIRSVARRVAVVDIAETHQASAFTALESWIPAGRIDRFIWSWVDYPDFSVWGGVERSFTDEHRFIFPKPADATNHSQICLRIEGTQSFLDGHEVSVAAGTTCHVQEPQFELDAPSWWRRITLPIWQPGLADTTVLRKAITAHVSVQPDVPGKEPLSQNTLVYFADWRSEKPLDVLSAALDRVRNTSPLTVIVVLPAGAFDGSRREIVSKLGSSTHRRARLQFTEDDESGWTDMFAASKMPSAYLINAKREFVWKHEGEPDPARLAAALDQHLVPTSAPRFRPLRLAISPGDPAPDALFETDGRERFALHRFRGHQDVLLNFWQSWSAPCLTELGRLQRLHRSGRDAPFIVAFHGGRDGNALGEIRKRLGLSFPLVQDSEQRIARTYGVRCWPTTVMVDADGRLQHIQFGIGHGHEPAPGREHSKPATARA